MEKKGVRDEMIIATKYSFFFNDYGWTDIFN